MLLEKDGTESLFTGENVRSLSVLAVNSQKTKMPQDFSASTTAIQHGLAGKRNGIKTTTRN